jgi:hypothetical protein
MALALFGPLHALLRAEITNIGNRAKFRLAIYLLLGLAGGLLLSAGLVGLSQAIGYPLAALVFALSLGLLAGLVHLMAGVAARRQRDRIARAQAGTKADLAAVAAVTRSVLPLLPVAAFLTAFILSRRR